MKRFLLILLGLITLVVGAIVQAPTQLIAHHLNPLLEARARVTLALPEGSVRTGSVGLFVAGDSIGRLDWHWQPLALVTAASVRFKIGWTPPSGSRMGNGDATIDVSLTHFTLQNVALEVDAALLARHIPAIALVQPSGRLRIDSDRFAISHRREPLLLAGDAELSWQGAGLAMTPVAPLGDYRLRVTGQRGAATLALATLRGALQLEGKGELAESARGTFTGSAQPMPQLDLPTRDALRPLLANFGPEVDGRHRLTFTLPAILPTRPKP
jgi:hypothetical protein